MRPYTTWILLLMISIYLSACAGTDPLLETEFPDTSQMALAKPLVPGLNAPEAAADPPETQTAEVEEASSSTEEVVDEPPVSILPAKQPQPVEANDNPPSVNSNPGQRVPSTLAANPCNEVDLAMIKSFEDEIADLEVYLESLTDILDRGEVRKEIKEKRRDLRKYKKDHNCK